MEIFKTNSFKFYTFNFEDAEHQEFLNSLLNDRDTKRFLKNIESTLEEEFYGVLDSSYVVGSDDKIIGYMSFVKENMGVSYNYAISPSYRNQGIGKKLLTETSAYLFKRYKALEYIELYIEDKNIKSINAAINAGFINDEGMLYHMYRGIQ